MNKKPQKGLPTYEGSLSTYSMITILIIGEAALIIAQAYFLARAITFLFQRMPIENVVTEIGFFFVAFLLRHLIAHIEVAIAERFAIKTAAMLRKRLLHVYFHRSIHFVQQIGTGHLVTLAMEGVDHVKNYVEMIGIRMIKTIVVPITIVIYIYLFDPISSVILVVTVPVVIIFMILLGMAAERMADKQYATYTRLSNHFIDSLKGLETLTYLGQSKDHAKKINRVSEAYRKATMKTLRVAFLSSFALDFFTSLSIAFVAVGLGLRLIDGTITLLPALTILILAPEYFAPIKQVGKDYHATLDGQIAMTEIDMLLDGKEKQLKLQEDNNERKQLTSITFSELSVEVKEKQLLQNITFHVNGGMIAIVGKSGAGKSTLIHVLAGRLHPTSGSITINDEEITTLQDEKWMSHIAYIPQQPYIFPLSLADNIRFYEPNASDKQVEEMIEKIGLKKFVESLPNGINEKIGEGARSLSGGQEQRIALARALLSDKSIILLDEPTAHLDIETEYEIKQLILEVCKDKFVFLATHRLHWMEQMDTILLLEDGRLVEQGTHQELLGLNGKYEAFLNWKRREGDE